MLKRGGRGSLRGLKRVCLLDDADHVVAIAVGFTEVEVQQNATRLILDDADAERYRKIRPEETP